MKVAKKKLDGLKTFKRFRNWCSRFDKNASPESLQEWDAEHNNGRIRAKWDNKYLLELGLKEAYQRFFYQYASIPIKDPTTGEIHHFAALRRADTTDGEENWVDLGSKPTPEAIESVVHKLQKTISTYALFLKFTGMPVETIRAYATKALEVLEETDSVSVNIPVGQSPIESRLEL